MSAEKVIDKVGTVIMTAFLIVGLWFFVSGFRLISPPDTVVRLVFGGAAALGSGVYLLWRWRRHRRKKAMIARVNWRPSLR